uniref:histidine kinase n=1 Tax=Aetherobacter rufus TaxID=888831 RepID=A0A3S7UUY2_9BACT|nr:two-component system sensor protein [Aetherobacter rufus]
MAAMARSDPADHRGLAARVLCGLVAGALYVAIDSWFDTRFQYGPSLRLHALALVHRVIDFVLPLVAGALSGLAVHYLRLRAAVAAAERERADELHGHLHKVERDQAVWVIAASLLHEVRTPIHALGLLLDEIDALPAAAEAERAALMERARAQSDRLLAHLGALKSLPAARRPELPRLDLGALVGRFARDAARLGDPDPIRIVATPEPGVAACANATYVQIILENLVENSVDALRARGGPGSIAIEVAREGDRAVVRVRDDGPGLEAEAAAALFEPLHSTKARGLGIGLAIARALARAMQGDLVLEQSAPATFRLELGIEIEIESEVTT